MIFEQLFDTKSSTYTYIISSGKGREALIIDPVIEHTDKYIEVLKNLELKLVKVIDTHIHADHISGLNELNKRTDCTRIMGEKSKSEVIDLRIKDSEKINVENIELKAIYTPGHTDCSYSYLMNDRVFTGDTLLINGTGRTDFQNGSSYDAYDSLFNKLLKLPGKTLVFPAHDYNGKKNSTIENEKNNNPRLQVSSKEQYAEIMNNLKLANQLLKMKRKAKEEKDRAFELQKQQQQGQIQMQSQQMAAQTAMQKIQAENQAKMQLEQAKAAFEIERLNAEANLKGTLMDKEFGYNQQLRDISERALKDRELQRESAKAKRISQANTEQSRLINQRKNNLPPQRFESNEDSLDGFDLAEFEPR